MSDRDIVSRLYMEAGSYPHGHELYEDAAAEIERLRDRLAKYEGRTQWWLGDDTERYDARHEDSVGDDDSGGDAGADGSDVGDGVPVPGGVRADRVREGLPDRYPWGDLDADWDPDTYADPRGDLDTYADHHGDTHPG